MPHSSFNFCQQRNNPKAFSHSPFRVILLWIVSMASMNSMVIGVNNVSMASMGNVVNAVNVVNVVNNGD